MVHEHPRVFTKRYGQRVVVFPRHVRRAVERTVECIVRDFAAHARVQPVAIILHALSCTVEAIALGC